MITDEQVIAAIAEFYKSGTGNGGMRKALEVYEQSKPKPEPFRHTDINGILTPVYVEQAHGIH